MAASHSKAKAGADQPRTTRKVMMARVHEALGRSQTQPPAEPAPVIDDDLVRLASATDDLPALFTKRAIEVGMKVQRVAAADVIGAVTRALTDRQAGRVGLSVYSMGDDFKLAESLELQGIETFDFASNAASLDAQFEFDAGVTDVRAAMAETGTMICTSGPRHSRGLSLVPPFHIAIVRASDILPDMLDFWAEIRGIPSPELPSSIAFITGPSKTADIEGVLVTGVHGPGEVLILLVDHA